MRIFGHYVSRVALVLAGIEGLFVYAVMYLVLLLHPELEPAGYSAGLTALIATVVVLFSLTLAGLYETEQPTMMEGPFGNALRTFLGLALAWILLRALLATNLVTLPGGTELLPGLGVVLLGLFGHRVFFNRVRTAEGLKRRLLVLGAGQQALSVENAHPEKAPGELPYTIVGYVPMSGRQIEMAFPPSRTIMPPPETELIDFVRGLKIDELVVAVEDRRGSLPVRQLLDCRLHGIAITNISTFFEREQQLIRLDSLDASWLIFGDGFRKGWARTFIKNSLDRVLSTILLIVTLPIMVITAIAIKLESRGPVFYWQTRVGMGNEPFEICKFRSMREDAEADGVAKWAAGTDDRVTRVGAIIRKLRIDELPQIINVFRGEMSFVGPRPERPFFVEQLSQEIPYFEARHSLRPGITGWAQVRYPYGASAHDARQKLQFDLYYAKNHTLFLDIVILMETIKVVLFARGAR